MAALVTFVMFMAAGVAYFALDAAARVSGAL